MNTRERLFLSGNEAIAYAAFDARITLGTGYPGTPSTEILETLATLGGSAQWAPNEKVALEVAIGSALVGGRALVTMKHVGLNVAADPLFSAAYVGVEGALVIVSTDDPGMASSQNEQDSRRYARAAGVPMLEPSDSQEAYDFTLLAFELSQRFGLPFLLRPTTRVCHSKSVLEIVRTGLTPPTVSFARNIQGRVMIPAHARGAHRQLREKLGAVAAWNEEFDSNTVVNSGGDLGVITSGVCYAHVREALPDAAVLKLALTYPLPLSRIRDFRRSVKRLFAIEEGDPILLESLRAAGIEVEAPYEGILFGELNVQRIREMFGDGVSDTAVPPKGTAPALCTGCPHRKTFEVLRDLDCIVAGDIGCYTLGALPPFSAMDSQLCMGASIGVGLGMRHTLPPEQASRVVSVIGDSTFFHSGVTGILEMVYNPPKTGHVVLILDNQTTAMTGLQEHPGTGRSLSHEPAGRVVIEELLSGAGVEDIRIVDPSLEQEKLKQELIDALTSHKLTVIIARRPCLLALKQLKRRASDSSNG